MSSNGQMNFQEQEAILLKLIEDNKKEKIESFLLEAPLDFFYQLSLPVLFKAIEKRNTKLLGHFILNGSDLDQRDEQGLTPLMYASQHGLDAAVDLFAYSEDNVNAQSLDNKTALFYGIDSENPDVLESLLDGGTEVDLPTKNGVTPLMLAAKIGNEKMVKLLSENGADMERTNDFGESAIDISGKNGHKNVHEFLVNYKDIHRELMQKKKQEKEQKMAKEVVASQKEFELLKENNLLKNVRESIIPKERKEKRPQVEGESLDYISEYKQKLKNEAKSAEEAGSSSPGNLDSLADIHNQNNLSGEKSKKLKNVRLMDFAEDKQAAIDAPEDASEDASEEEKLTSGEPGKGTQEVISSKYIAHKEGQQREEIIDFRKVKSLTPKEANEGNPELSKKIPPSKALSNDTGEGTSSATNEDLSKINQKLEQGKTLLMIASSKGLKEEVERLILANANINSRDDLGYTALIHATLNSHPDVVSSLIQAKCDLDIKDNKGQTALVHAVLRNNLIIMNRLIKSGSFLNITLKGTNLLMLAARHGFTQACETLLSFGFDPKAQDFKGRMAWAYAKEGGHQKLEDFLKRVKRQLPSG